MVERHSAILAPILRPRLLAQHLADTCPGWAAVVVVGHSVLPSAEAGEAMLILIRADFPASVCQYPLCAEGST